MARSFIIGILVLMTVTWLPAQERSEGAAAITLHGADSTEYQLIIIDPYFDQWYIYNFDSAKDRTNEFYRTKNLIAVSQWNNHYRTGRYPEVIDCHIDYEAGTNYGMDLNRRLYWYFKYINSKYRVPLF